MGKWNPDDEANKPFKSLNCFAVFLNFQFKKKKFK